MSLRPLSPQLIADTAKLLETRVAERFPESGLRRVIDDLAALARSAGPRAQRLGRPLWPLRAAVWALGLLALFAVAYAVRRAQMAPGQTSNLTDLLQGADAAVNLVILLFAAIYSLWNFEEGYKRRQALTLIHELRELAHVIDMHQLTKDPGTLRTHAGTEHSPKRVLTRVQLGRYLDYCSEALALVGKIAAVYAQHIGDPAVLDAVDGIEDLTTGLSRKVWQKIAILQTTHPVEAP